MQVDTGGNLTPELDNAYALGKAGRRFSAIWAANGVIQTSDSRDKRTERPIAPKLACAMVEAVNPILFRWKSGGRVVEELGESTPQPQESAASFEQSPRPCRVTEKKGQRLNAGFLAQEVKAALDETGLDFGAWGLEDTTYPESRQWLRPDQLILVLWAALKETRSELREIKKRLASPPRA